MKVAYVRAYLQEGRQGEDRGDVGHDVSRQPAPRAFLTVNLPLTRTSGVALRMLHFSSPRTIYRWLEKVSNNTTLHTNSELILLL